MNIEELSEKHAKECAYSAHDKIGLYPQDQMWVFNAAKSSIRDAMTEQAEAFKGELQAHDGMVRELTKTVEDMQAAQSVAVVGEVVAWVNAVQLSRVRKGYLKNVYLHGDSGREIDNLVALYLAPTHSITASELATLREKAAMADELRKDAERYRWLQKQSSYLLKKLQQASITDSGDVTYFHADKFDAAVDAAIAQGKGE